MPERRKSSRQKSFLHGRIFFNNRRTSVDCLVRDLSEQGAKLRFSAAIATPELIELHIPNRDESYRARVQWRTGDDMGVIFDIEDAAPPLVPNTAPPDWAARMTKLEHDYAVLLRKVNELQAAMRKLQGVE